MKENKLFSHYGPGGRNCNCCGPAPAFRKKHDRMVKRRVKQFVNKEIKSETRG
jgi:hypothetical protein